MDSYKWVYPELAPSTLMYALVYSRGPRSRFQSVGDNVVELHARVVINDTAL